MISSLLGLLCIFMMLIAYFAWKRNGEAVVAFDREQQLIAWFRADRQLYIEQYDNKVLFPRLQKTPAGWRVLDNSNHIWWTLEEWFTEQHPYVAHVMRHESHKMGGSNDDKQVVNPAYKLRRINPKKKKNG